MSHDVNIRLCESSNGDTIHELVRVQISVQANLWLISLRHTCNTTLPGAVFNALILMLQKCCSIALNATQTTSPMGEVNRLIGCYPDYADCVVILNIDRLGCPTSPGCSFGLGTSGNLCFTILAGQLRCVTRAACVSVQNGSRYLRKKHALACNRYAMGEEQKTYISRRDDLWH